MAGWKNHQENHRCPEKDHKHCGSLSMTKFKVFYFLVAVFLLPFCLNSQNEIKNNAFTDGEKLRYTLSYNSSFGEVSAGEAVIEVKKDTFNNKPVYHLVGIGETNNFFDVFYKVRDKFESKVDPSTVLPYTYIRNTREGKYSFDDTVLFDRKEKIAFSARKKVAIPEDVFDIVSGVYFMRRLSVEDFGEDSVYYLNFYLDDSIYNSVIKFEGRGVVETDWGWLPCIKVKPMLATGEVFTNKYPMAVWITDDENHIPVMAESEVVVGSIKMVLTGFEGLKHPFIEPLTKEEMESYK